MIHTLVLGCSLNYGLHRVRRKATRETQHNLAPDETGLLAATRCSPETDEHTHGDSEKTDTSDSEPFEVSNMADYEADANTSED